MKERDDEEGGRGQVGGAGAGTRSVQSRVAESGAPAPRCMEMYPPGCPGEGRTGGGSGGRESADGAFIWITDCANLQPCRAGGFR